MKINFLHLNYFLKFNKGNKTFNSFLINKFPYKNNKSKFDNKNLNFYRTQIFHFSTNTKSNKKTENKTENKNENFTLEKMTEIQKIYYFNDLKNIYFDFNFGPRFKFLYLAAHLSTIYLISNNFLQFYWMYQAFYGSTMFSIAYLNYELYADLEQKKILDRFIHLM